MRGAGRSSSSSARGSGNNNNGYVLGVSEPLTLRPGERLPGLPSTLPADQRLVARKLRNRESAAASRERARLHTQGLEQQVASLTGAVEALFSERDALRKSLHAAHERLLALGEAEASLPLLPRLVQVDVSSILSRRGTSGGGDSHHLTMTSRHQGGAESANGVASTGARGGSRGSASGSGSVISHGSSSGGSTRRASPSLSSLRQSADRLQQQQQHKPTAKRQHAVVPRSADASGPGASSSSSSSASMRTQQHVRGASRSSTFAYGDGPVREVVNGFDGDDRVDAVASASGGVFSGLVGSSNISSRVRQQFFSGAVSSGLSAATASLAARRVSSYPAGGPAGIASTASGSKRRRSHFFDDGDGDNGPSGRGYNDDDCGDYDNDDDAVFESRSHSGEVSRDYSGRQRRFEREDDDEEEEDEGAGEKTSAYRCYDELPVGQHRNERRGDDDDDDDSEGDSVSCGQEHGSGRNGRNRLQAASDSASDSGSMRNANDHDRDPDGGSENAAARKQLQQQQRQAILLRQHQALLPAVCSEASSSTAGGNAGVGASANYSPSYVDNTLESSANSNAAGAVIGDSQPSAPASSSPLHSRSTNGGGTGGHESESFAIGAAAAAADEAAMILADLPTAAAAAAAAQSAEP